MRHLRGKCDQRRNRRQGDGQRSRRRVQGAEDSPRGGAAGSSVHDELHAVPQPAAGGVWLPRFRRVGDTPQELRRRDGQGRHVHQPFQQEQRRNRRGVLERPDRGLRHRLGRRRDRAEDGKRQVVPGHECRRAQLPSGEPLQCLQVRHGKLQCVPRRPTGELPAGTSEVLFRQIAEGILQK